MTINVPTGNLSFTAGSDDAFAKLQLQMMGAFAEFERNIIRKRQAEGIAKAKLKGLYKGRPKTVDEKKILEMRQAGIGASAIAREFGTGRSTVYKALQTEG
ncbi:MAG: helix-turn-helix domain-containing protein [Thalassovita sp.]